MFGEGVHENAYRVKSRGLVLSVKPERFRLPFVRNTSVPVILENKNNYPISYSVGTSSPTALKIDPKDGCIEPGEEAQILIRRPSRIFMTQNEEHLVFKVKGCSGCDNDREPKSCIKTMLVDSQSHGEMSRRKQFSKPFSDSKQRGVSNERTYQPYQVRKISRYYENENSNPYDEQYSPTGSHFIDDYESNRGRHKKRDFHELHERTHENFNRDTRNYNVTSCTGSIIVGNNHSKKNQSSQFFPTTGPDFKDNVNSYGTIESNGVSKAPKHIKGGEKDRNVSDPKSQKLRNGYSSNREGYSNLKYIPQNRKDARGPHLNRGFRENAVSKAPQLDKNGDKSRYNHTLFPNGSNCKTNGNSNREYHKGQEFTERNQRRKIAHVKADFVNEDDARLLYKSSDTRPGSEFSERGDSNHEIRCYKNRTGDRLKADKSGNGNDRRKPSPTRPNVHKKSKYDDNTRDNRRKQFRCPETQPDRITHKKKYSYQYETCANNLQYDVRPDKDVYFDSDKESRSFDSADCKGEKELDETRNQKSSSESLFRKIIRRMTSVVVPPTKPDENGNDEKSSETGEESYCDCCCKAKHTKELAALKIRIKDQEESVPLVNNLTLRKKKLLSYVLLIFLITTVAVLATFCQDTLVLPYFTPVEPSFWEMLKD